MTSESNKSSPFNYYGNRDAFCGYTGPDPCADQGEYGDMSQAMGYGEQEEYEKGAHYSAGPESESAHHGDYSHEAGTSVESSPDSVRHSVAGTQEPLPSPRASSSRDKGKSSRSKGKASSSGPQCHDCGEFYADNNSLKKHQDRHKEPRFPCSEAEDGCEKRCHTQKEVQRHVATHHPRAARDKGLENRRGDCPHCGKSFQRDDYIKNHRASCPALKGQQSASGRSRK